MRTTVIVVLVIGAAIGAYYFLALGTADIAGSTTKNFTLRVENKKIVEGSPTLTVKQNDTVNIHITIDEAEELHLHGYDRSIDLEPNTEATLTLTADISGRFPFELEHSKTDLGSLEVLP